MTTPKRTTKLAVFGKTKGDRIWIYYYSQESMLNYHAKLLNDNPDYRRNS